MFVSRGSLGRGGILGLLVAVPSPAFAYGPGATPSEAVVNAAAAVFGQGNFLALVVAGLWLGLLAAQSKGEARLARSVSLAAAILALLLGWVVGAPAYLSLLIAASGLVLALLIAARLRLRGPAASLPPAAIVALFGLGLGSTLRLGGAPIEYVAAYMAVFTFASCAALVAGAWLAGPILRRGGDKAVRGLGVWAAVISLPVMAMAIMPGGPGFGADAVDLRVRSTQLGPQEIEPLVASLLERVYLAFEAEDENAIFDALDAVAEGRVRDDLYLQRRAALVMEDAGGARATLRALELETAEGEPLPGNSGYRVRGVWNVTGTVGHWGHLHDRVNRYAADLAIAPIEGVWKLAGFDLLDVERTGVAATATP